MNWREVNLSDVCSNIFAGGDVPKNNYSKFKTDKYQVPIFANGEKHKGLYGYTDIKKVTEQCITVSARGTIGYSEIRHEPFFPIVRLIVLVPNLDIIDLHFLKYAIQGIDFVNSGSSIPQLTVPMIKNYTFLLPSVVEQKCIVAILDEAFANIEQARANTEQNLKNARELFESYIQQVFSNRDEQWVESTLNKIAVNLDSKRVPITKIDRVAGKYPYYGASGIVDYVDSFLFEEDLLLVSEDGANLLARTYPIAFIATGKYWVNNHAHVLRFESRSMQKFVEYYLNSISLAPYVSGMAQPKLNQKALNSISIPTVSERTAFEVVEKLKYLEDEVLRLKLCYEKKINALDELKKSILQKAFTGELTNKMNSEVVYE